MVPTISVENLKEIIDQNPGATVIDVRNHNEYEEARLNNVPLIPLMELTKSSLEAAIPGITQGDTIYFICRSGTRSDMACQKISEFGFDCINVEGGMLKWQEVGYDTVTGAV
jgi:rhodanese-related sulfurtransferase